MNNKEFITELAQRTGYSVDDTQRLAKTLVETMAQWLEEGENVSVTSFGTFEVKKRLERVVVNPGTGKRMLVPPKLVVGFRPVSAIKEKLKKGGQDNGQTA